MKQRRWRPFFEWFGCGFVCEALWEGKWFPAHGYYRIDIGSWRWGRSHYYYDGPNDKFSIGFLHFSWSGDWCDQCIFPPMYISTIMVRQSDEL